MTKLLSIMLALTAMSGGVAYLAHAGFTTPHLATGSVNTAVTATDLLYICRPSGSVVNPICPIDTAGADEDIFVSGENLLPGSVRWEKVRLRNVSTDPWDILSLTRQWEELSDPSGLCTALPEPVVYQGGVRDDEVFLATGTQFGLQIAGVSDTSKDFVALGVVSGDIVRVASGTGSVQSRNITSVSPTFLAVSPDFTLPFSSTAYTVVRRPPAGPGVTVLGRPNPGGPAEPLEGVLYEGGWGVHPYVAGSGTAVFRLFTVSPEPQPMTIHVPPGDYVDLLLGVRLPVNAPSDCLNVVWQLTTTWDVRVHFLP